MKSVAMAWRAHHVAEDGRCLKDGQLAGVAQVSVALRHVRVHCPRARERVGRQRRKAHARKPLLDRSRARAHAGVRMRGVGHLEKVFPCAVRCMAYTTGRAASWPTTQHRGERAQTVLGCKREALRLELCGEGRTGLQRGKSVRLDGGPERTQHCACKQRCPGACAGAPAPRPLLGAQQRCGPGTCTCRSRRPGTAAQAARVECRAQLRCCRAPCPHTAPWQSRSRAS